MIVLCIADADAVMRGEPQLEQCRLQATGLVRSRRKNHYGRVIENDVKLETQISNHPEDLDFIRAQCGNDYLAFT
jgi:hypothetical protein